MGNFKAWFRAAGVRAVKTVAQTAVATIGTSVAMGDVNWILVGSASLLDANVWTPEQHASGWEKVTA